MLSVKEIMNSDFLKLPSSRSVESAIKLLHERNANYLLVEKNGKIMSVIALHELSAYPAEKIIADCEIKETESMRDATSLAVVLKLLERKKKNFFVVLDKKKAPVGIVSRENVLSAISRQLEKLSGEKESYFLRANKAEANAQQKEEKFKNLFENAVDPIVILDKKGRFVEINRKVEEIIGYTKKDLIGKKFTKTGILDWKSTITAYTNFVKRMAGLKIEPYEVRIIKKDGGTIIGEINAAVLRVRGKVTADVVIIRDITARKKAEEALQQTSSYLESLLECANAPIIVWDSKFRITRFNRAFEHMTGYSADEVNDKPLEMLFPEKSCYESLRKIRRTLKWDHWESVEIPILCKDKQIRLVLWNFANVCSEGRKKVLATIAQGMDITERKKKDNALLESEEKYKDLLDNANDIIQSVDSTGRFLYVNKKWVKTLGYSEKDAKKMTIQDIIRKDQLPHCMEVFRKICEGESAYDIETVFVSKGGHEVYVEGNANAGLQKDGVIATRGIFHDITARKKTEEDLRQTGKYLENLIDYANAPIIIWDPQFRITRFNRAFEHMTGYGTAEINNKTLKMLFPKKSRDKSVSKIRRALQGEHWESVELPLLCKDGQTRIALWNSANVYAKDGTTLLATMAQGMDITDRKKAEEEIEKTKDTLAMKVEDLERFNKVAVDRELKMVELKRRIKELENKLTAR